MATIYMDPVGGNNANDGLTFANRKRTFNSATTAAGGGGAVRVIASPDPFSVGSGTWTDNTKSITFTNNSNVLVDGCDSGWTGVTNVTVSHPTDNAERTGTSWLSCAIASAFTTGKIAYKALPAPLTISAFQQIAFYMRTSLTGTLTFKIALCSDTTGDTIVAELNKTLTYPTDYVNTNEWIRVTLDYGSAFPGTAINSIAVYFTVDPSNKTIGFDGFVLCKAPYASDLIDYNSMIGKNTSGEPEWYPVGEITNTGVSIGGNIRTSLAACRPYRGTSESVTTYIRNPLILVDPWTDTDAAIKSPSVSIEGGWNRTDMSTKTGQTWISGNSKYSGYNGDTVNRYNTDVSNIGFINFTTGMKNLLVGDDDGIYDILGFLACETPVTYLLTGTGSGYQSRNAGYVKLTFKQVWDSRFALTLPSRPGEYTVGRIHGFSYDDAATNAAFSPGMSYEFNTPTYNIGKVDNNVNGIALYNSSNPGLKLSGTVLENNTNNFRIAGGGMSGGTYNLHLDNMFDWALDTDLSTLALTNSLQSNPSVLRQTRIGGDPTKHRTIISGNLCFETSQTIRHTASGYSWRLFSPLWDSFMFYRPAGVPAFPLAKVAVEADKMVTVTCWVYIEYDPYTTYAGTSAFPHGLWGIMIDPDAYMGLTRVQVEADMSIVASWQQVEMTFTPSEAGVVTISAYAYGTGDQEYLEPPAHYSAYYDDLEVTQEP